METKSEADDDFVLIDSEKPVQFFVVDSSKVHFPTKEKKDYIFDLVEAYLSANEKFIIYKNNPFYNDFKTLNSDQYKAKLSNIINNYLQSKPIEKGVKFLNKIVDIYTKHYQVLPTENIPFVFKKQDLAVATIKLNDSALIILDYKNSKQNIALLDKFCTFAKSSSNELFRAHNIGDESSSVYVIQKTNGSIMLNNQRMKAPYVVSGFIKNTEVNCFNNNLENKDFDVLEFVPNNTGIHLVSEKSPIILLSKNKECIDFEIVEAQQNSTSRLDNIRKVDYLVAFDLDQTFGKTTSQVINANASVVNCPLQV